ncbi:MAG: hypothetical protein RBT69_07780 [Spirochaetia bacterium]|jgi:hypothetical protein|nr:hypothetical protein [Spirochaetia bacterium]
MEGSKITLKYYILLIQLIFFTGFISARGAESFLPENYETRREFLNIITGSNSEIQLQQDVIADSYITGRKVKFQVLKRDNYWYFLFLNEKTGRYGTDFPLVSAGTYIIKRNIQSGMLEQIKVFLNNDPGTYVRITEQGKESLLEFVLFDSKIYKDVLLPAALGQFISQPFESVIIMSDYIVDWNMLKAVYNETENNLLRNITVKIDEKLPLLSDSEDGALGSDGRFIFIETLKTNPAQGFNCSGFTKWISDGVYFAKTNRYMDVDKLKKKNFTERRDTLSLLYEDLRDPLFGLDWSRNIAMVLYELDHPDSRVSVSDVDVSTYPYEMYVPDIGYPVSSLKALLYYLAVTDPGYIYLGSINGDFGTDPVLRQHYHIAAFLPYINSEGDFFPVLYERNRKTGIDEFIKKYSGESIHLVKIKAEQNYTLPEVPQSGLFDE